MGQGRPPTPRPAPRYLQRLRCAPSRPPPGLTCCLGRAARGAGTCSSASCLRRSAAFSWILRCSSSTRSSREGAPAAADCAFFSSHLGGRRGWLRRTPPRVDSRDFGAGGEGRSGRGSPQRLYLFAPCISQFKKYSVGINYLGIGDKMRTPFHLALPLPLLPRDGCG